MISYYTTLITRIESIEGYTEDAQVVYIGEYDKHDKNLVGISEYFDDLDLATYKGNCYLGIDAGSTGASTEKLLSNLQMSRKNYEKAGKLNEKIIVNYFSL